jgi:uncharacterized membrane protein
MDDRMRVSDADREQVSALLREHYAEGRLTSDELDERITATLSAKTFGDLRRVMADLPEPGLAGPRPGQAPPGQAPPQWAGRPVFAFRRGPRLLPLLFLAFIAMLAFGGGAGFVFLAIFKVILLVWLVMMVAGLFTVARFRRHGRRNGHSGMASQWQHRDWRH